VEELPQAPTLAAATTARAAREAHRIVRVICVGSTSAKLVFAVTPGYREDP